MTVGTDDTSRAVRVVNIYATRWRYRGDKLVELHDRLALDQLGQYYEMYRDQLPKALEEVENHTDLIRLPSPVDGVEVRHAEMHLFALPSNQVVVAVTFEVMVKSLLNPHDAEPITKLLRQCMDDHVLVDYAWLNEYVGQVEIDGLTMEVTGEGPDLPALRPERHHLVFIDRSGDDDEPAPSEELIGEIVFRDEPPYADELRPEQLQVPRVGPPHNAFGVVTPTVSVVYGHERSVEDSIYISTVQAVGTAARFHEIWLEAYVQVRTFRDVKQKQKPGQQVRDDLEDLADNLGNLEFDLTFSVRFPLMPPKIDSFHSALYEALDLSAEAQLLSQMFTQIAGSLHSEITAIDIRDRRQDEGRQRWNSFAAAILSLVGVSVGFVVTFLGINATEVQGATRSMWDDAYASMYFIATLFALTPVLFISFPYLRDWSRKRGDALVVGLGVVAGMLGAGLVWYDWPYHSVVSAVLMATGFLPSVLGLLLAGEWIYRLLRHPSQPAAPGPAVNVKSA